MFHPDPIVRRLHACAAASLPACLWGPPGTGKTERVKAYARARGLHLERWLLSRCEPIDLKPRVFHNGKVIVSEAPEIERLRASGSGILFGDEANRAARETEGAALDIFDSPPPGVWVVIACNPPSKGQAARSLESATANRFVHLDVGADANAWANAQVGGWPDSDGSDLALPNPAELAKADAKARALVSAYIRKQPNVLESTPQNTVEAGRAWASTRTWEYLRKLHGVALALHLDAEDTVALLSGCVGTGNATTYLAYCEECDLGDPEDALKHPDKFRPKDRVDKSIAELTAIAGAVESNFTDARWKAAWGIIDKVVQADQADAAMVAGDLLVDAYKRLGKKDAKAHGALTKPQTLMPERMARILTGK